MPIRPLLGIMARTFACTAPNAALSLARNAGYGVVQYNMACSGLPSLPRTLPSDVVTDLTIAIHNTGVDVVALSATCNLIHPDAAARGAGLRSLAVLADVAQQVGISILTLCSGSRNSMDQWAPHPDNAGAAAWRDLLDCMRAAVRVAKQFDVMLAIEPEPANVVHSAASARRLLDELQSDRVGIVLDAANLLGPVLGASPDAQREVIARAVEQLADRIILVHAKDRRADGSLAAPGDGVVDFDYYFATLAAAGIRVPVIAHGLDAVDAQRAAAYLRDRITASYLA